MGRGEIPHRQYSLRRTFLRPRFGESPEPTVYSPDGKSYEKAVYTSHFGVKLAFCLARLRLCTSRAKQGELCARSTFGREMSSLISPLKGITNAFLNG